MVATRKPQPDQPLFQSGFPAFTGAFPSFNTDGKGLGDKSISFGNGGGFAPLAMTPLSAETILANQDSAYQTQIEALLKSLPFSSDAEVKASQANIAKAKEILLQIKTFLLNQSISRVIFDHEIKFLLNQNKTKEAATLALKHPDKNVKESTLLQIFTACVKAHAFEKAVEVRKYMAETTKAASHALFVNFYLAPLIETAFLPMTSHPPEEQDLAFLTYAIQRFKAWPEAAVPEIPSEDLKALWLCLVLQILKA